MSKSNQFIAGLLFGLFFVFTSTQSMAEEIPLVDGKVWAESSATGKKAYIVGISNLMSVEYAFQKNSKQPPKDDQSIVRRLFENSDEATLDGIIKRIDQWYKKNPDQTDKAVLNVIWVVMVQPNLSDSGNK